MDATETIKLFAHYNQWMNENVYKAVLPLSPERLKQDLGAYFKSILGTLNHIMVGDIIWLKRFTKHPAHFSALKKMDNYSHPKSLSELLYVTVEPMWQARKDLDDVIWQFSEQLRPEDLDHPFSYSNFVGQSFTKRFGLVLLHLFNHQTHHRGQLTTLLTQSGVDVGVTDLPYVVPDVVLPSDDDESEESN